MDRFLIALILAALLLLLPAKAFGGAVAACFFSLLFHSFCQSFRRICAYAGENGRLVVV